MADARLRRSAVAAWDSIYSGSSMPEWELNPLDDQASFAVDCSINTRNVSRVLDIGCGRWRRALLCALRAFNESHITYVGVDVSSAAIDAGAALIEEVRKGVLPDELKQYLRSDECRVRCELEYRVSDILALEQEVKSGACEPFDVVIDWWCLHELPKTLWESYVRTIRRICRRVYMLCVFSEESSSVGRLPDSVPGVRKYQFSDDRIRGLFGGFEVKLARSFEEAGLERGAKKGGDGSFVAAKRAYLLVARKLGS